MKNILCIAGGLFLSILLHSCQKDDLNPTDFSISTATTTVKAGERVVFNLIGNPDFVTFFSGENGKKYENAQRSSFEGKPILQFTSARANGTQEGSLSLMISNDFKGIVPGDRPTTINRISEAKWVDITSRAQLSNGAATASGEVDLSDFASDKEPVYIGFRYVGKSGSIQSKWTISALTVVNRLTDGTSYTLANLTSGVLTNYGIANIFSPGWVSQQIVNDYNWSISGSALTITGSTSAQAGDAEAWVMAGPIQLREVCPDIGTFVKGMDVQINNYSYTYPSPGEYVATFVGASKNIYGEKEVVKTVRLTVN